MLTAWSSHLFSTDWGTRAVAENDPVYKPISYHQGTVWPLFTGWNSLAQYHSARPLAGYAALRKNLSLTWAGDPGAVTELLSGRFYQPLGRSSSHQLWSSAMVVAPAVRGLFGLGPDATTNTLVVHPQLPASWDRASLDNVRVGATLYAVRMVKEGDRLRVTVNSTQPTVLCLRTAADKQTPCTEQPAAQHTLSLPLPLVEAELLNPADPQPGDSTHGTRVIDEQRDAHSLRLLLEGAPGSEARMLLRINGKARLTSAGGSLQGGELRVVLPAATTPQAMPQGDGPFTTQLVTLHW